MVKKDFYNTGKLLHKLELKFGDDSEFLLEFTNKIYEEVTYQDYQYTQRSSFWTHLVINWSVLLAKQRRLEQAFHGLLFSFQITLFPINNLRAYFSAIHNDMFSC